MHSLEMANCEFVSTSPDRPNIVYEVHRCMDFDTGLNPVICSLKEKKQMAPRVIVYSRSLDVC